ncbi:MAG TPA: ferritin-like domain-containing protein [Bacteroidales bacterium]|jgi:ferritin-like metal-binding protein YciE|nr:ferritin-like domain-containing protein [Bacteroidales bacterium]
MATATQKQQAVKDSLLEEFFVDELKDIYWAEKHLHKNLPKLQNAASSPQLKKAFEDHTRVTADQISRLEEIFRFLDHKAEAKKCDAMEGLVSEAQSIIEDTEKNTATRDVALILAAQKVEHYEIATYGGLAQLANTLGLEKVANLLGETLEEEKETDELLTDIAENDINYQASNEG